MDSLASRAQLWSRARPAHAVRARSPRRAFAHQAGGGASRAQLTVLSCAGTDFSCGVAVDFIELQLLARAAHGVCAQPRPSVRHAHVHLQPTYRFPMFDSLQLGTCASTAITTTIGNEVAVIFFAAACSFFDESMLARAPRLLPRVTARRRGAARRRSRWLWRRTRAAAIFRRLGRPARARPAAQSALCGPPTARALLSWLPEKNVRMERSFLAIPACLSARKHASRTPEARATHRYAAHALGSRTQNTIIRPIIR